MKSSTDVENSSVTYKTDGKAASATSVSHLAATYSNPDIPKGDINIFKDFKNNKGVTQKDLLIDLPGVNLKTPDGVESFVVNLKLGFPEIDRPNSSGKEFGADSFVMGNVGNLEVDSRWLSYTEKNGSTKKYSEEELVMQAFRNTVKELQENCKNNPDGTTMCAAFVFGGKLYIANVGDSLLCVEEAGKLSNPVNQLHDNENAIEAERVLRAGGTIEADRAMNQARNMGLLSFRSIGCCAENGKRLIPGVTAKPEMSVINLNERKITNVLIASDGLTKVLNRDTKKTGLNDLQDACEQSQSGLQATATTFFSDLDKQIQLKGKDDTLVQIFDPAKNDGNFFVVCDGHGGTTSSYQVTKEFGNVFKKNLNNVLTNGLTPADRKEIDDEKKFEEQNQSLKEQLKANPEFLLEKKQRYITGYVNHLEHLYGQLHPAKGQHSQMAAELVKKLTAINKDEKPASDKLKLEFETVSEEIGKLMREAAKYNKNQRPFGSIDAFITFLNEEKELSKHHYARLVTFLYQNLLKEQIKTRSDISEEKQISLSINDGNMRKLSQFTSSLFRGSSRESTNPYKEARRYLSGEHSDYKILDKINKYNFGNV